jgi:hypothetical protein
MNFQPAGQSLLVLNDCSETLLKSVAPSDPFETQQAIESALAIPEGLPEHGCIPMKQDAERVWKPVT